MKKKNSHFKILPLLVMVSLLSFSVRVAEVMFDLSTLSGGAMAQEEVSVEVEKAHEGEEASTAETEVNVTVEAEGDHADEGGNAHEEAAVKETTTEKATVTTVVQERTLPVWRDANDVDPAYMDVKSEIMDEVAMRREALDKRSRELATREALLKAAEKELDRKYAELNDLREDILGLLERQSNEEEARIQSLRKVYENMKPKDAARIFNTLDLDVLIAVVGDMSERKLSPILAAMEPERAQTITIMLAEQKQLPDLPSVY